MMRRFFREILTFVTIGFYLIMFLALREENNPAFGDYVPILVIGSMGAGTQALTRQLRRLGLDVRHEVTGADGAVSWLHMLLLRSNFTNATGLCDLRGIGTWSPTNLGREQCDNEQCCLDIIEKWRGCLPSCPIQFGTPLFVVRHPLRTIESLSSSFCRPGIKPSQVPQLQMASTLLDFDLSQTSDCLEAFALYWRAFYSLDIITFQTHTIQREHLKACDVVLHATKTSKIIPPRLKRALSFCKMPLPSLRYSALVLRQFFYDLRDPYSGVLVKAQPKSSRRSLNNVTMATFQDPTLAHDLAVLAHRFNFSSPFLPHDADDQQEEVEINSSLTAFDDDSRRHRGGNQNLE
mmetsp:Transcript_3102/g.4812  ORF Transcript_3102/g.4812 Transcript_3102/m.4812 type:complete len:350 (+) Transcript_3102:909-1958(+)